MEEQFLASLLADARVFALAGDNVSWSWPDQGAPLPRITLTKTDGPRDPLLAGGVSGFVDGHVQADCWGATQLAAKQLARALVACVVGLNVDLTNGIIQGAFVDHEHDESEGEKPDRIFRTRLSLRVPYTETFGE